MTRGSIIRSHGLLYCSLLRGSRAWGWRMGLRSAWGPASQTQEFSGATLSSFTQKESEVSEVSQPVRTRACTGPRDVGLPWDFVPRTMGGGKQTCWEGKQTWGSEEGPVNGYLFVGKEKQGTGCRIAQSPEMLHFGQLAD